MTGLPPPAYLDAACFRLSRLCELSREAEGMDYRGRTLEQLERLAVELKCTIGRDRFEEGARRHAGWLASLGYEGYLACGDWQAVRYFAMRQAGYVCAGCGYGRDLEVHHRSYERLCVELLADVVVLCPACHAGEHELRPGRGRRGLRKVDGLASFDVVSMSERSGDGLYVGAA